MDTQKNLRNWRHRGWVGSRAHLFAFREQAWCLFWDRMEVGWHYLASILSDHPFTGPNRLLRFIGNHADIPAVPRSRTASQWWPSSIFRVHHPKSHAPSFLCFLLLTISNTLSYLTQHFHTTILSLQHNFSHSFSSPTLNSPSCHLPTTPGSITLGSPIYHRHSILWRTQSTTTLPLFTLVTLRKSSSSMSKFISKTVFVMYQHPAGLCWVFRYLEHRRTPQGSTLCQQGFCDQQPWWTLCQGSHSPYFHPGLPYHPRAGWCMPRYHHHIWATGWNHPGVRHHHVATTTKLPPWIRRIAKLSSPDICNDAKVWFSLVHWIFLWTENWTCGSVQKNAEFWTGPSVQVQWCLVQVQQWSEPELNLWINENCK